MQTDESVEVIEMQRASGGLQVLSAADVLRRAKLIEDVKAAVMKNGTHYGVVPGCGDKPTLLKPGAEKLLMTFGLQTRLDITIRDLGNAHREYQVITHVVAGRNEIAQGVGVCSTMESKYRYRRGSRKCPTCSKERTLIQTKGGRNPGGYWCVPDKGGCNANFPPGEKAIEGQQVGNVDNPDIADVFNTVLKMAKKRSLVDAALTSCAASDFFAQDLEELADKEAAFEAEAAAEAEKEKTKKAKAEAAKKTEDPPAKTAAPAPAAAPAAAAPKNDDEWMDSIGQGQKPAHAAAAATVNAAAAINAAAAAGAANSNPDLRSLAGLSLDQWQALSEEQRAAEGHVTRAQCKVINDLLKKQGVSHEIFLSEVRNDFPDEFGDLQVVHLWQLNKKIAGFAITNLKMA